jgi:hypothetical protein
VEWTDEERSRRRQGQDGTDEESNHRGREGEQRDATKRKGGTGGPAEGGKGDHDLSTSSRRTRKKIGHEKREKAQKEERGTDEVRSSNFCRRCRATCGGQVRRRRKHEARWNAYHRHSSAGGVARLLASVPDQHAVEVAGLVESAAERGGTVRPSPVGERRRPLRIAGLPASNRPPFGASVHSPPWRSPDKGPK